jgi:bifunctional oligoribonuclease and PAP phosphatase NrnA
VSEAKQRAAEFERELARASSVLIGTHLNPDGDALGSALALSHFLDHRGIPNEVLNHHNPPYNLEFLPGVRRIKHEPEEKCDLGIVLDLDSLERLGSVEEFFTSCSRLVVIDHHVPHAAPGDLRIVDTGAAATALILAELLMEIGGPISPEMATCLLTGIVTDTGSFRFRNTSPEALSMAARLIELGGDITLVSEEIFHRKPLSSARLLGFLLERMELECSDQLAWGVLSRRDFELTGARDEDTEGFVNELLSIRTVKIATIIREPKPGSVRASLRSRGEYDVAEVARHFGGGGHRNAAGCSFDGRTVEEAVAQLVPRLRECLESC